MVPNRRIWWFSPLVPAVIAGCVTTILYFVGNFDHTDSTLKGWIVFLATIVVCFIIGVFGYAGPTA